MSFSKQKTSYTISNKCDNYVKNMRDLMNDENCSDITFKLQDSNGKTISFKANRYIINARCDSLSLLIHQNEMKVNCNTFLEQPVVNNEIKLKDISPCAFSCLLEFIYSNSATLEDKSPDELIDILEIGNEFIMNDLSLLTEKQMLKVMNLLNAYDFIAAALYFGSENFREAVIDYVTKNARTIFELDGIEKVPGAAMFRIVASDELKLKEMEVVTIVRRWAMSQAFIGKTSLLDAARPITGIIRYSLLSQEDLVKVEEINKNDPFIPHEYIIEAWRNKALGKEVKNPRKVKSIKSKINPSFQRKSITENGEHSECCLNL